MHVNSVYKRHIKIIYSASWYATKHGPGQNATFHAAHWLEMRLGFPFSFTLLCFKHSLQRLSDPHTDSWFVDNWGLCVFLYFRNENPLQNCLISSCSKFKSVIFFSVELYNMWAFTSETSKMNQTTHFHHFTLFR